MVVMIINTHIMPLLVLLVHFFSSGQSGQRELYYPQSSKSTRCIQPGHGGSYNLPPWPLQAESLHT